MPRHPALSPHTLTLKPSVFTRLLPHFRTLAEPPIGLHIGDTWIAPPEAARIDRVAERLKGRNPYVYSSPDGEDRLRDAFVERWSRLGVAGLDRDRVHISCGATGGVFAALQTFVEPGDEVLVLSPFWPLVRGMIVSLGAVPVEVPFYRRLRDGESIADILTPHLSPRTTALYVISPNNPDGTVLDAARRAELARFCVSNDLWVVSDEAYADYVFEPAERGFLANEVGMAGRTASVYTVSKSYALAGIRIGFLVGDASWLDVARRVTTHTVYNLPMICQEAAFGAITEGDPWVEQARERYAAAATRVSRDLDADFLAAEGGGYVFVDLAREIGERDTMEVLIELLGHGVSLSPGSAFGQDWQHHVRVCYMSVPEDRLQLAIERLNRAFALLRKR